MLKHTENEEEPISAAETRVKIEELAQAVSSIEARKLEEARRLEGTVVLGDAVRDLQLEITPDELLAEVQQKRQQPPQTKLPSEKKPFWLMLSEWKFTWRGIFAASVLGFLAGWLPGGFNANNSNTAPPEPTTIHPAPVMLTPSPPSPPASMLMPPPPAPPPPMSQQSDFIPLSQIPNGASVELSSGEVKDLLSDGAEPGIRIGTWTTQRVPGAPINQGDWRVARHDRNVYISGWVKSRPTNDLSPNTQLHIYNQAGIADLGEKPVQVSFCIGNFKYQGVFRREFASSTKEFRDIEKDGNFDAELIISDVHLDQHTFEKW